MDLRRERKRSFKVREQQQAELERIEATVVRKGRAIFAEEINRVFHIPLLIFVGGVSRWRAGYEL